VIDSAGTPATSLHVVRDLERTLDVRERGRAYAERRLGEARRCADELLRNARTEAVAEGGSRRAAILAAADDDAATVLARADEAAIALQALVQTARPDLVAAMRAVVLPRAVSSEER
jgi:hypothetical protein